MTSCLKTVSHFPTLTSCETVMEGSSPVLLMVALVSLFTSQFTVSGQSITITAPTTLVIPTSELRITCQPSSAGISDVISISIQKNSSTSDYTVLVSVSYSKVSSSSVISWSNTVLQNRQGVSASGNVDTVSSAQLVLTITQNNTRCEDGGAYKCNTGVTLTGGSGGVANDEKYVTATDASVDVTTPFSGGLQSTVASQSISIIGTARFAVPASEIRIICQPSSTGVSIIHSIDIFRNSTTVPYNKIGSINYDGNSVSVITWYNTDLRDRVGVSLTGKINSPANAQIVFIISRGNTRCEDAGAYKCRIRATLTNGNNGQSEVDKYVALYAAPTYTNALSLITSRGLYEDKVGSNVKLVCSGTVGSDKLSHQWCYRRGRDSDFIVYPDESAIQQNEVDLVKTGCNYIRTSSIAVVLSPDDRSTTFMCEPNIGRACGQNRDGLKSNFTLTNDVPLMESVTEASSVPEKCNCKNIPWIVVALVSIVINVIAGIIIISFKRRSRYRNYEVKNRREATIAKQHITDG